MSSFKVRTISQPGREVVGEAQDEFEAAINYGHEICQLLEVKAWVADKVAESLTRSSS